MYMPRVKDNIERTELYNIICSLHLFEREFKSLFLVGQISHTMDRCQ